MESPSAMLPSSTLSVPLKLLDRVVKLKLTDAVYEHLVQYVTAMVKVDPDDAHVLEPSPSTLQAGKNLKIPPSSRVLDKPLPTLHDFIENISVRSRCTMSTMLVALIYLDRLQKIILLKHPTGKPCARHRVIFSALMISHKIWNDSSMIGKHWAEVSNLFTSQEVLAMEREILVLLRYDLELTIEEIWAAARPFLKKPFLAVDTQEVAEAEAAFVEDTRMRHDLVNFLQIRNLQQNRQQQSSPMAYPETIALPMASAQPATPIHFSQHVHQHSSHEPRHLHPFSSLNYSSIPLGSRPSGQPAQSACSSPATFDPFETTVYSPALQSSPLLTSPLLQAIRRPDGANHGIINVSRTHTTRSSAGSMTRTTTRLTMRNVSHVTVASKGTSAHPYLHNHPPHPHCHSAIIPGARFKKKKSVSSIQRFHLPTSMHLHPTLRSDHSSCSSPYHSNVSSSSSSSATTSIPSSPSSQGVGSGVSVYAHSPSMVWYALPQKLYNEHGQPHYSYASTIALPPVATTGF